MSQLTTHVLDTARGRPAVGVDLQLYRQDKGNWLELASGCTNDDGRIAGLLPADTVLAAGTYRMHFATGPYFASLGVAAFYPWVDVVFTIDGSGAHYHIPLLLSPFGYSTYRGS